jgi:hypothetical protein
MTPNRFVAIRANQPESLPKSRAVRRLALFLSVLCLVLFSGEHHGWSAGPVAELESGTEIVIHKGSQVLELFRDGVKLREYRVCLGVNALGHKRITGDQRTPEGRYFVCYKNTASQFHRFLGISYPGEEDAQRAFEKGTVSLDERDSIIAAVRSGQKPPWNTRLGGWVGIHGYPTDSVRQLWISLFFPKPHNWTDGCVAMWNYEVEELFAQVPVGTPVRILPSPGQAGGPDGKPIGRLVGASYSRP